MIYIALKFEKHELSR